MLWLGELRSRCSGGAVQCSARFRQAGSEGDTLARVLRRSLSRNPAQNSNRGCSNYICLLTGPCNIAEISMAAVVSILTKKWDDNKQFRTCNNCFTAGTATPAVVLWRQSQKWPQLRSRQCITDKLPTSHPTTPGCSQQRGGAGRRTALTSRQDVFISGDTFIHHRAGLQQSTQYSQHVLFS